MKILLSNDDSVFAKGIATMYAALAKQHDVTVIAPDRNCSGASNALSLHQPLRIQKMDSGFFAVNGTPSDCVHLGVNSFLEEDPELVVSGINHGANLGDDVIYSGTVAAATEGRYMGLPAIAVSLCNYDGGHFETAARVVVEVIEKLITHPLPANQILNINVPDLPYEELAGVKVTRQGRRHRAESMVKAKDAFGRPIYWYGPAGAEQDAGPGTDFHAIAHGYCSVTPLSVDMTARDSIAEMEKWLEM
ncbi:MAG: 5'/3'-nucleotidase SurE [Pseudomonadota bacterium]|nr:5'/3'-nucleotidase SurE [Pseudomonadota bacterium]HCA75001.1 5'/3'-nucleotidase SurE [Alteromonas sp.]HCL10885.1 5'/3'-nucleotidase SurE [Alteromonas sp.]HCV18463.1 5'/3'-nucleotidase SurE [Alteromonas sp.]|tara:strand:+ start:200 stop:943 length:744 start_codon:yes stop_codon:yes gene_type:complete